MIKFLVFLYKNREKLEKLLENYDKIDTKSNKKKYSLYGVPDDQITLVNQVLNKKEV